MRRGRYDDYYDEVYGRTPPRRRGKKRGRGVLLLLVLLLALGALFIALGAWRGEVQTVWRKAINICMECIGIG